MTFHKEHLHQDRHLDAVLVGPGHSLYAAVDEKLNKMLASMAGGRAAYLDEASEAPYRLHFFELSVKENTKGEIQTLYGELVAVREDLPAPSGARQAGLHAAAPERFAVVLADFLLDLPAHPSPPAEIEPFDPTPRYVPKPLEPPREPRTPPVVEMLSKALAWRQELDAGTVATQADIARREGSPAPGSRRCSCSSVSRRTSRRPS